MPQVKTVQGLILALQGFWSKQGCVLAQPYDVEKGATNFARNFDPAFLAGIAKSAGVADFEPRKGEKLPDEVLEKIQPTLRRMLGRPEDVADAVLYVVTAPPEVNVAEIVVRPPRQLPL